RRDRAAQVRVGEHGANARDPRALEARRPLAAPGLRGRARDPLKAGRYRPRGSPLREATVTVQRWCSKKLATARSKAVRTAPVPSEASRATSTAARPRRRAPRECPPPS